MIGTKVMMAAAASLVGMLMTGAASAATCVGACGTSGDDGMIATSPDGGDYNYVNLYLSCAPKFRTG